jgi:acyl dehydratase
VTATAHQSGQAGEKRPARSRDPATRGVWDVMQRAERLTAHGPPSRHRNPPLTETSVSKLFLEDFQPGRVFEHGPRRLPRQEMMAFAAEFDPQPMHLDEAAARATMMGGLCASGWYLCCIVMRMVVDGFAHNAASMGAPGVDEVKWLIPVRPDEEVRLRATVIETRASRSRPDMGFVRFTFELFNGEGIRAMTLSSSMMMGRRDALHPAGGASETKGGQ